MTGEPAHSDPAERDALAAWFDVPRLLEDSRPRPSGALLLLPPLCIGGLVTALVLTLFRPGALGTVVAALLLMGSFAATFYLSRLARAAGAERDRVREADELVTLRHWTGAAGLLRKLLAEPMRLPPARRGALTALVRVLGRYGLHDEAIDVADAVLDDPHTDPATRYGVACGRAMLLLQGDRLSDANDAIGRLKSETRQIAAAVDRQRREASEAGESSEADESRAEDDDAQIPPESLLDDEPSLLPPSAEPPAAFEPAALLLVELYRDVQTYHDAEALELYDAKWRAIRDQVGVRLADAAAFAATAAHRLGEGDRAASLWLDATALQPAAELLRRYPEVREVADAHPATLWPEGAA